MNVFLPSLLPYGFAYALGGAAYPLMELGFRGYSHWSMSLAGGLAMTAIHLFNCLLPSLPFVFKCLLCAVVILEIELVIGCAVNRVGKPKVWDYSDQKFNFLGQICLKYFFLWLFLSAPALLVSNLISFWLSPP